MLKRQCKGSALISALFIMTLVAIAATAMSTRLHLDIYRTQLTLVSDKLYLASQVVSFWAMGELSDKSLRLIKSDEKGKVLDFPKKFQAIYPSLLIEGALYDLQSRFNINNLSDKKYYPIFLKLLSNIDPKSTIATRVAILNATSQWLSPYVPGKGNDELMTYYLKQNPPYYPSQQLLENLSEFRLIRGVNAKIYQSLSPFLTALREITPININTASKKLLLSLSNQMNEEKVKEILQARGELGINRKTLSTLLKKLNIRDELITLQSQYFMSIALVKKEDIHLVNVAIIKRSKNKDGQIMISLISESINCV